MFGEAFFYIIGVYTFLWWFVDNLKSLFAILWSLLKSYIQPDKNPPLNEKFGTWAGKNQQIMVMCIFENKINCTRFSKSKFKSNCHVPSYRIVSIAIAYFALWFNSFMNHDKFDAFFYFSACLFG